MYNRNTPKFHTIKGKVGFCQNKNIPALRNKTGGHYVYIRKIDKNGVCTVSTVTSLEDAKSNIYCGKMAQVRNGNIYSIPKRDGNFSKWSGVNKNTHYVHISNIYDIGKRSFKKRHHFMIGKNK